jgi:hypothetical protein
MGNPSPSSAAAISLFTDLPFRKACERPASDLANILKDMELLIERKLKMFPDDKRQIVSARVVMVGKDYRIEVASATLQ